jgi:hypothetical protein
LRGPPSHGDDDLAAGVAVDQVADGCGDLTEGIGPVDGRPDLACVDELAERDQVGGVLG